MKIYALYFSPIGGTKKVLDIVCSAWDCQKKYIDLSAIRQTDLPDSFAKNDICIVSVPSFSGRVPQFIIPILQQIHGNKAKTLLISTYGNRAFDDTLLELKDTMEKSDFLCYCAIAAVTRHSVMPKYGAGRPDADDIEELKHFAIQCQKILNGHYAPINVPGSKPYREYHSIPITPRANRHCIDCGICYERCPVHAIPSNNYRKCDTNTCISCLQCITVCPHKARHVNARMLKIAEIKMKKVCSGRKPNLLFIPNK